MGSAVGRNDGTNVGFLEGAVEGEPVDTLGPEGKQTVKNETNFELMGPCTHSFYV